MPRPGEPTRVANPYLIGTRGPSVVVPARVASVMEAEMGAALGDLRRHARGVDPEVAGVLLALRAAAMSCPVPGEELAVAASEELPSGSEWMSTTEAAEVLGVTRRAVSKAIASRSLPARKVGRSWRIQRRDLQAPGAPRPRK